MAELTFKSPGVSTKEIDLSGPTQTGPVGTPAGVIGTADQGRAFVPITMANFADFIAEFGNTDGTKFGPMAMRAWLNYRQAGTYLRVLGVGDGKRRSTTTGVVTNAGFVVGEELPKGNGDLGANAFAGTRSGANPGPLGRTHFLAVCMEGQTMPNSEETYLTEAGLKNNIPILRGVLLAASGVQPALSASRGAGASNAPVGTRGSKDYGGGLFSGNNTPLGSPKAKNLAADTAFGSGDTNNAGSTLGAVDIAAGKQEFVLLLNGHTHTDAYPTVITASFDPIAPNYLGNVLNTDPLDLQKAGHYLYTHYPVYSSFALPTGSQLFSDDYCPAVGGRNEVLGSGNTRDDGVAIVGGKQTRLEDIAFLVTSSLGRNGGSATIPDFEGFRDRFRTAKAPKIISQKFGGNNLDLFRVCCLDDGEMGNHRVKISIENIIKSTNANNKYGTFDLLVRDFEDTDDLPVVIESFKKLSLNPVDERYIARVIGDYYLFYDFDKRVGSQKLVVEGSYPNRSNFIRIEPTTALDRGDIPAEALPVGFRGIDHLVTSGSSIFTMTSADFARDIINTTDYPSENIVQPPIAYRSTVSRGKSPRKILASQLYWGVQSERKDNKNEPNKSTVFDTGLYQWGTYFPNFRLDQQAAMVGDNAGISDVGGTVLDCDRFNNNKFSLENIQVIVTAADKADSNQWAAATYRRNGTAEDMADIDGSTKTTVSGLTRLLSIEKDFGLSSARKFLKFTTIAQGGFDGLNMFDREKSLMSSTACKREMDDANQGETSGPTVAAYRKALDILEERSDVNIQLLAIPGIKHSSVTDYAISTVEDRFDALYIMDLETQDNLGNVVTGSSAIASVTNTVSGFTSRNLDSSFAAAYFPDVIMKEVNTGQNVVAPPSVAVLGAFGLNDSVAFPWFAPAGFTRGALKNVLEGNVKLNRENLDSLYEADINPITSFPQSNEVVVFGQKTLLAAQSALDRVNVRRLLIDIRRQVRAIGDTFLFEPNREATLARFSAAVTPILGRIQAQQGLERFKVQIDTTTTTQADIENNTVRGKIFLQPVRSVEFISLDFVVTNAGMDI